MLSMFEMFRLGARELVRGIYSQFPEVGLSKADYELLTKEGAWTFEEANKVKSIMVEAVGIVMTKTGLPPVDMPYQYVAAFICEVVAPANRLQACVKAPTSFQIETGTDMQDVNFSIKNASLEQLMACVMAFSSGEMVEPHMDRKLNELWEDYQSRQLNEDVPRIKSVKGVK